MLHLRPRSSALAAPFFVLIPNYICGCPVGSLAAGGIIECARGGGKEGKKMASEASLEVGEEVGGGGGRR